MLSAAQLESPGGRQCADGAMSNASPEHDQHVDEYDIGAGYADDCRLDSKCGMKASKAGATGRKKLLLPLGAAHGPRKSQSAADDARRGEPLGEVVFIPSPRKKKKKEEKKRLYIPKNSQAKRPKHSTEQVD
eukprot:TRINITY_DN7335_c0_g1_i1.p1 TRINITY_DN7335_c0_g1~~TRINITY_DN7335_c0_g1_i1.p1  ORF type:complete len:149 (+),score=20.84 TRINITY_DN7335_c0_g1_i1:54-449(+)